MSRVRLAGMLALVAILSFAGCRETGPAGEFFRITGKLVVFNYRNAVATFMVTLSPTQPAQAGQVAIGTFENPAGGGPVTVQQPVWPKLEHQTVESPPLTCIVRNRPYSIKIEIADEKGQVLQTIETTIVSSEDQQIMPDEPLVVGPVYTPNPELAGHPDGKLPGSAPACPQQG